MGNVNMDDLILGLRNRAAALTNAADTLEREYASVRPELEPAPAPRRPATRRWAPGQGEAPPPVPSRERLDAVANHIAPGSVPKRKAKATRRKPAPDAPLAEPDAPPAEDLDTGEVSDATMAHVIQVAIDVAGMLAGTVTAGLNDKHFLTTFKNYLASKGLPHDEDTVLEAINLARLANA